MDDRFIETHSQGGFLSAEVKIFVDKRTGVNYVFVHDGYAGGLTVMVDANGKPIVTPVSE